MTTNESTSQRVALVTGAAGGIGSATAWGLARAGCAVALTGRGETVVKLAREMNEQGFKAWAHVADLNSEQAAKDLVRATLAHYGRIDVLVNNAGLHVYKGEGAICPIEEMTLDQWQSVFMLNLTIPFLLSREVIPGMRERGHGRIVNIHSRGGRTFVPGISADYVATKAGLQGFTRALAGENASYGITANCVAPGRIDTPQANKVDEEIYKKSVKAIPVGRAGVPDEVAAAIVFLASDAAAYITGSVIDVNGGGFMP